MSSPSSSAGVSQDAPARWIAIWLAAYPAGLVLASVIAGARPHERAHGASVPMVLATASCAAAWHWFAALRRPEAHRQTRPMLPWAIVAIVVTAALVAMAPVYLFAASFLYAALFVLLPGRSAIVASLLLSAALFVPLESTLGHTFASVMTGGGIGASLLSGFIVEVVQQNRQRRETIAALRAAESTIADLQRNAGRLEERARIARELHDTVTQDLVSVGLQIDRIDASASDVPPALRGELARLRERSAGALLDARQLIAGHRPRQLGASFASALETLNTDGLADAPRVEVRVDSDLGLRPEEEALLFRVAQEAVTNARKHARASAITITVSRVGARVHLDVVDDGIGFDPRGARRAESFGLESMRTRVESVRGALAIERAPGEGTAVHVELAI